MKYRQVKGTMFRVRCAWHNYLIEVVDDEDQMKSLAEACAEIALGGDHITSVTQVFADRTGTPRVSVLTTKEYRQALKDVSERMRKEEEAKYIRVNHSTR